MFLVIGRFSRGPDRTCSPKGVPISMSPISVTRLARRGCWEVFVQMYHLNTQDTSKNNNDDANKVAGKPHILDTTPRQLPGTCFHSLPSIDGRAHGDHPLICSEQGWQTFSVKSLIVNNLKLCSPHNLCPNYSTLLF